MGSFASRLRGRLVICLVTLPLLVAGALAVPVSAGASKAPIKIAILNEASGEFAAQFGPVQVGAMAWVNWENAHGGVDGHHIDAKIYNNGSNPSSAVANAHLAVAQGAVALIDSDPLFDSYAPYLHSLDMPVYAFGITPGFYGASNNSFFSYSGDISNGKSDASIKFFIDKYHKTKFAVISDPSPADSEDIEADIPTIKAVGGTVVYENTSVDPTNTADLLSVAQAIKSSGAQVVLSAAGGNEAQDQVDLAQVGAGNIWVSNGSDYEESLPQQYGSSLNNYTFFFFTAPFTVPTPGMQDYAKAMKKYAPKDLDSFNTLVGWASGELLAGGIAKLGNKAVTRQSLTSATNELKNFTGDGTLAPVTFPIMHTQTTRCLAFVQVKNGKWTQISGTKTKPFYCTNGLS
jgi:branched-chain amino acid transport system substrate-binding protein